MIGADNGVIICECHGKVSQNLPVNEIASFLQRRQSGLKVVIGDNFCEPQVLSRLIKEGDLHPRIIGACSLLKNKENSLELGVHRSHVIDLLQEVEASYSEAELVSRVKLLFCGEMHRRSGSRVIPAGMARFDFPKPGGEVTRRQLFELALPKYALPLFIEQSKCVGGEKCHLCQGKCPAGAIEWERGQVAIDQTACWGCGACIAVCPFEAIVYATFSSEELEKQMKGLLLPNDLLEPRILAIVCQTCISVSIGKFHYPPNVLPLEIPCLAMVSPSFLLRAFDLGAQGLVLISNRCQFELDCNWWQGNVEFARELLAKLGIEPQRIEVLGGDELDQALTRFAQEVARLGPTPLRFSSPVERLEEELWLPALVKGMGDKLGISLRGTVAVGEGPFGKVKLTGSKCTACGLCTLDCPTGALSFSSGEAASYHLLFSQQACIGCGQCVNSCPEKCLRLENLLELECLNGPTEVLFQDEIGRCRECGAPIAFQSMLISIKEKLSMSGEDASYLDLCSGCRMKSQSRLVSR